LRVGGPTAGALAGHRFYGCSRFPHCRGTHGAHQETGEPLGIPGDRATKDARIRAHAAFDPLWKDGSMRRNDAYYWLSRALGIPRKDVHIGLFDTETCERVVSLCEQYLAMRRLSGADRLLE
ncbi:MAG TPA: zinc-finger-containing protein, partial [Candidatus Saccharimonadales bacterium]|nr:zinc-finger-containing protein [Candidatus Saccharimonadales bacterium]